MGWSKVRKSYKKLYLVCDEKGVLAEYDTTSLLKLLWYLHRRLRKAKKGEKLLIVVWLTNMR